MRDDRVKTLGRMASEARARSGEGASIRSLIYAMDRDIAGLEECLDGLTVGELEDLLRACTIVEAWACRAHKHKREARVDA